MQQNVVDHIRTQCEKLSTQTKMIEEKSQPFDSVDLESLSAVKDFLHHEQVITLFLFISLTEISTFFSSFR